MALLALARARALSLPAAARRAMAPATRKPAPAPRRASAAAASGGEGLPPAARVQQMTVQELAELLSLGDDGCDGVQFVDVREPGEFATAKLPRFLLYPLSAAADWAPKADEILNKDARTIVLCHHGVRSMNAATFFVGEKGFTDVWNVTGGIDAYSKGVDEGVPRY